MPSNPFVYPRGKHKRSQTPPPSNDYRTFKPALRIEYRNKCVFCMAPDTIKGYDAFSVEHYRPKSKFPALSTDYTNLFYCCVTCNRLKGNKWPTEPEIFVPNPDEHSMLQHLRYSRETVQPLTKAGEYTCDLLRLNDSNLIRFRNAIITSIESIEKELLALGKIARAITKAYNKGEIDLAERDRSLAEVEADREERQKAVNAFAGID